MLKQFLSFKREKQEEQEALFLQPGWGAPSQNRLAPSEYVEWSEASFVAAAAETRNWLPPGFDGGSGGRGRQFPHPPFPGPPSTLAGTALAPHYPETFWVFGAAARRFRPSCRWQSRRWR